MSHDVTVAYLHRPQVGHNFADSLLRMWIWDSQHDSRFTKVMTLGAPSNGPATARNSVVQEFLTTSDQWLLWLDDDMGFAPDTLNRLMAAADPTDRPIVGALCFALRELGPDGLGGFHCMAKPTLYEWTDQGGGVRKFASTSEYPPDTVVPVAATGSACILIHRSVFESIMDQYESDPPKGKLYDPIRGSDGDLLGEDISFCVRAAGLGYPIHVHTGVPTNHMKSIWVGEPMFEAETTLTRTLQKMEVPV